MLATRRFDYFAEEHSYERKTRFFNSAVRETSLELYQQFLPTRMNRSRSPRSGVDCHRHSTRHKSRKQDDQHFRDTHIKYVRSFSDSSPNHFTRDFPPEKLSQLHPADGLLDHSILNRPDFLFSSQSSSLHSESSSTGINSLGSLVDSRPGSSDESISNRSPIRQPGTSSPDNFRFFRRFEDTVRIPDTFDPNYSVGNRNECCQANFETLKDLNTNFSKIKSELTDVNDNYSALQSPVHEQSECSLNTHIDVFNESSIPLITKEVEEDTYCGQRSPVREQGNRSPSIPVVKKKLEVKELADEIEKDDYSGQGSSVCDQEICRPSIQKDVLNVLLINKKIVVTKQDDYSGQHSPVHEQQTHRPSAQKDVPNVLLTAKKMEKDQSLDRSLKQTLPYHCSNHPSSQLFYCQTCCKSICKDCATHCARKHVTVDLVEFVEIAQRQAEDVLMEAYLGIDVLADDMENMGMDMAALDFRTREALSEVKFFSRRMWSAVEEREKKLFKQIVEARRWKFEVLHEKYMNLRDDKTRLAQAVNALKYAIHETRSSALSCNPDDLLKRKDMVLAEIWQIRQNRKTKCRSSREENWISFRSSENSVLPVIANGGNVLVNNPGTIGDRLPHRDYRLSQPFFPYGMNELILQSIPRGRPIADYDHNIILPSRESELYVRSTDVKIIGHFGDNSPDNLCRPWGVTCDNEGNIIVSDRSNNRIQIYREDGTLVRRFGTYGNGPCEFNRPAGIAVDARRRLIVVDKDNHRVQILTMEGGFLMSFGEHGEKQGQFCYPWDVAVNAVCEIAVTDTRNHRIQLFSAEGIPLRMFGGQPHLIRYLDSPRGICFNNEGKLIVTDFNNHHVLIIDYNLVEMRILKCDKEFKSKRQDDSGGNDDGQNDENAPAFQRPQGVVVTDDGSILVADSRHNSIKAFNSLGMLIYSYRPGQEEMDRPLGVALHWDGRMAFTDYGRNYVRLVKLTNHVDPVPRNAIMFG